MKNTHNLATVLKSFRMPSDVAKQLAELSNETHRTETYYLNLAISRYMEDVMDVHIARDRFNDPDSRHLTSESLRTQLGV